MCMNLCVIHKYLKVHFYSHKPGQQKRADCKRTLRQQGSLFNTVPEGLHVIKMALFVNVCAGLLAAFNADGKYVQWC